MTPEEIYQAVVVNALRLPPADQKRLVKVLAPDQDMEAITKNVIRLLGYCERHSAEIRKMPFRQFLEQEPSDCRACMRETVAAKHSYPPGTCIPPETHGMMPP